jgi:hypothetical protein
MVLPPRRFFQGHVREVLPEIGRVLDETDCAMVSR